MPEDAEIESRRLAAPARGSEPSTRDLYLRWDVPEHTGENFPHLTVSGGRGRCGCTRSKTLDGLFEDWA